MTDSMARQVADAVRQRARSVAHDMATRIGTPIDGQQPNRAEQAALWNLRAPKVDQAEVDQLIAAGQHAQAVDLVFPWRNRLIGPGSPTKRTEKAETLARQAADLEVQP